MKDAIDLKIREVRGVIKKIAILGFIMDSISIFLIFAIIICILGFGIEYAIIPAVIYIVIGTSRKIKNSKAIDKIASKYPSLDDRLQTANDNKGKSNLIIDNLMSDVSKRMDEISYSSFIETRKLMHKVLLTIFLVIAFLSTNFININAFGINVNNGIWNSVMDFTGLSISGQEFIGEGGKTEISEYSAPDELKSAGGESGGEQPGISEGPIPGRGGGAGESPGEDIFGEASSADVIGEDIRMEIHPEYGGDIDIKDVDDEGESVEFSLSDIRGADIPEQEPVEYEELIRRYFEKLLEEEE